jgi:hypothetical protein
MNTCLQSTVITVMILGTWCCEAPVAKPTAKNGIVDQTIEWRTTPAWDATPTASFDCFFSFDETTNTFFPDFRPVCQLLDCFAMQQQEPHRCTNILHEIAQTGGADLCMTVGSDQSCVHFTPF